MPLIIGFLFFRRHGGWKAFLQQIRPTRVRVPCLNQCSRISGNPLHLLLPPLFDDPLWQYHHYLGGVQAELPAHSHVFFPVQFVICGNLLYHRCGALDAFQHLWSPEAHITGELWDTNVLFLCLWLH